MSSRGLDRHGYDLAIMPCRYCGSRGCPRMNDCRRKRTEPTPPQEPSHADEIPICH